HEQAKSTMQKMAVFQGVDARFLPNTPVSRSMTLFDGPGRIELFFFGPGHTGGDLVVVFPQSGLAHLGDLFPAKAAPVIDSANGGSGVAFPETLARAVTELQGVRRVSTGHDPGYLPPRGATLTVMSWADLQEYAAFNRDFLSAVRAAFDAGKTADEATATL